MTQQLTDKRDVEFVLWEQLEQDILSDDRHQEFNRKTCDMILTEARRDAAPVPIINHPDVRRNRSTFRGSATERSKNRP